MNIKYFIRSVTLLMTVFSISALGQLSFTTNTTQTIDFSNAVTGVNAANYDGSGLASAPAAGQLDSDGFVVTGFNNAADLTRGTTGGGVTTGGLYSLNGNVAIWIQPGGSDFTPGDITLIVQNDGAVNIEQIGIRYDVLFRNDQNRSNSLNLSYSSDNITYTPVPANDFTTPEASDALGNQTFMPPAAIVSGLSITPGNQFFIRWTGDDVAGGGSRDELGLDNIDVTARFAPTAAAGTISGRARTSSGQGVKHAVIMLTGGNLQEPIYATTNQFGNYQFQDITVGDTYVLQIMSGRYTFQNASRVVNLDDSITDADFVTVDLGGGDQDGSKGQRSPIFKKDNSKKRQ